MPEKKDLLKDKLILIVDDETDVLETIEEDLSTAMVHKAADYDTAAQYLLSYTYDIVILDIMGVNGFELLKQSVTLGFPTVMLTAHALSPETLKKSIKLGAVFYLPKESMPDLRLFLEDILSNAGKSIWDKFFNKFSTLFASKFGPDWKTKDQFFTEFEREMKNQG